MGNTTLQELAALVNGQLTGEQSCEITGAATLKTATSTEVTFVDNLRLQENLESSPVAAAIVPNDFPETHKPTIRVERPREAFAQIVQFFRPLPRMQPVGISPQANISDSATVGADTCVYPGAQIGDDVVIGQRCRIFPGCVIMPGCKIGDDVTLFPNVTVYEGCEIGSRSIIHASAIIGAYGFGYDTVQGQHNLGAQYGYVKIESDVEIGANSTVDRGSYGPTIIGEGTKIDNLVMIAHNCRIGKHNLICSQVGVAGSSSTGDYVVMAGQVGIPDHVTVGHRSVIGAKSGIMRSVPDDSTMLGIPATPERDQMAKQAAFARLPEMRKQLRKLQKTVDSLTSSPSLRATDAA